MRNSAIIAALLIGATAHAQHGAGDDRVSLPEGPGSLEGIGDNAAIKGNMGSMSYAVPIEVPAGFPAVTPDLALLYDSAGPAGVMGIGWDMPLPFVERMTNWRLPDYDLDDDFVAGGQLVHIGDGVYRNRFEKEFARHTWHDRGDGTQGYWTTEMPDGTVQYFGATPDGTLVESARVAGRGGATFRYHLVAQVDRFGHRMDFSYRLYDGLPHLDRVAYIFTGSDGGPGASITFEYEDRPDALSDARSGSNERRTQRLTHVNVFSKQVRIWRYGVHYEDAALSNGLSRVRRIDRVGLNDTPHPVALDFEYSKTLANDNCDEDCDQPYLVSMGSIGVNLAAGNATLADMNGDGLPDIIDTSRAGAHRVFLNRYQARDAHVFDAPYDSAVGTRDGHQLSSPYVQTLDANGDGRVDLINVRTGEVLYNLGGGDWAEAADLGDTASLPDFGDDFGGGADEPTHVRFFDYDNDRRIDVMRSTLDQTQIYANQGAAGFAVVEGIDAIGAGFDGGLDLADMNGDGLLDPVILRAGSLSYRLNLGFGRWSAWVDIEDLPFNEAERAFVELQDINGDSLDDLVIVLGDELRFALNRAGTHFDAMQVIDTVGGQALPVRADGTTVLYADMNGSGSDDVVWISPQGDVTYLELFPIRPNLLTKLTNGLGLVTEVTYTTMVEERAAAEEPWVHALPFSMLMAKSISTYDSYNEQRRTQTFSYADAFYDTEEKAYRGFAGVTEVVAGDATQETRHTTRRYDIGAEDRYRNGLLLDTAIYAVVDDTLAPLRATATTYADCPVADVPDAGLTWPVRHVCAEASELLLQERMPEADWVRTRSEYTYDGDGNLTMSALLGVVDIGGAGCAPCTDDGLFGTPCGATCTGDEMYTWTEYTRSSTRWILGLQTTQRSAAVLDHPDASAVETYYDGDAFEGLPLGSATLGLVTRRRIRTAADTWVDTTRTEFDAHGNPITNLNPMPEGAGQSVVERQQYDDESLLLTAIEIDLGDYSLRTTNTYDPIWGVIDQSNGPVVVQDGEAITPDRITRLTYDDLGYLSSRANPGDPADRPTATFESQFGAPVSRVITRHRTQTGAATPDQTVVLCRDGFGRDVAELVENAPGEVHVNSYHQVNRNGQPIARFRPAIIADDTCLFDTPEHALERRRYDALGRLVSTTRDDADEYGTDSRSAAIYLPLSRHDYSPDDWAGPHADTPLTRTFDGLGRLVSATMRETADGAPLTWQFAYDVRGGLAQSVSPGGNIRRFERDLAGRVVVADDPDRGRVTRRYDAADKVVEMTDAEGRVQHSRHDALGRLIATWDGADEAGTRVEYQYDLATHCPDELCAAGAAQRVAMTFPTPTGRGERWLTHDLRGQLVGVRTRVDGVVFDERFEYDNMGRLIATIQPDGTEERLTRDALGRVIAIDGVAEFTYGKAHQRIESRMANGLTLTQRFDALDRLEQARLTGDGAALLDLTYGYSRIDDLIAIDDAATPADQPGLGARLDYDALNRLTQAELDPGRPDFNEVITYGYDRRLNLASKVSSRGEASASHVGALTYDAQMPHAIVQAGARSYAYDAAGMRIDHNGKTLEWDADGRLRRAVDDAGESQYWYADQRIISRAPDAHRIHVSPTFEIEDGIALSYSYVGLDRIATRESDALAPAVLGDLAPLADGAPAPDGIFNTGDAVVAARAEGGAIDLPEGARHGAVRSMLRGAVRSRLLDGAVRTTFQHTDARRQRVLETDADGAVIARYAVDPHGVSRTGTKTFGFEGRTLAAGTDLVPMGARLLDPWLGRWVTPDPEFTFGDSPLERMRVIEAANPYGFVMDNPVRYTDPSGRVGELATFLNGAIQSEGLPYGDLTRGDLTPLQLTVFVFQPNAVARTNTVVQQMDNFAKHAQEQLEDLLPKVQAAADLLYAMIEARERNVNNVAQSSIDIERQRVNRLVRKAEYAKSVIADVNARRSAVLRNVHYIRQGAQYRSPDKSRDRVRGYIGGLMRLARQRVAAMRAPRPPLPQAPRARPRPAAPGQRQAVKAPQGAPKPPPRVRR